ncbi:MAG: glycosyltransferase family 4 protein [Candidatus Binatia bacterium]
MNSTSGTRHLLFINHTEFWGGAEANLLEVSKALANSNYRVWVAGPGESAVGRACTDASIAYHAIRFPAFKVPPLVLARQLLAFVAHARQMCDEVQPDVIISCSARCNLYATIIYLLRRRCVQVWMLQDFTISKLHLLICGWIPSAYIAVSNAVKRYSGKQSAHVIGNAFSIPPGSPVRPEVSRDQSSPFIVGYFGRFVRLKGVHVLLDAMERLLDKGVPATLRLYGGLTTGDVAYVEELRLKIATSRLDGSVVFRGFQPDVLGAMTECSLVVSPTLVTNGGPETFGRTVIEAMIAGTPVVATDCGGPAELIQNNETGILVPPGNAPALAEAIERVFRNRSWAGTLTENAAGRLERYSSSTVAQQYITILDSLL